MAQEVVSSLDSAPRKKIVMNDEDWEKYGWRIC